MFDGAPVALVSSSGGALVLSAETCSAARLEGLRGMAPSGVTLAVSHRRADTLKARVGGEVFLLEPGATARGLVARCAPQRQAGGVTLARHLPWDQAPVTIETASAGSGLQPTHILLQSKAVAVNGSVLSLGTQPAEGERWLDLGQDMAGVSRRHCDIVAANGQCVVTDHSRYGTFLNGHRIDGSAALQTGDVIRVGTPGVELRLIHVE